MEKAIYRWETKSPTGRWKSLRWKMTAEDAQAWAKREGVEIRSVPGSGETIRDVRGSGNLMDQVRVPGRDD